MENGGVKNIVLIALVVVFSFFIGSLATEGFKTALMPLVMIIGAFAMLYLGKNSKYLIIFLPRVASLFNISVGINLSCVIASCVFFYWIFMRFMGYVRLKWTSLPVMDILVLLIFLHVIDTFYRHPVAMAALGLETDLMGGADYIACLFGILAYVAISCIPFTALELCKTFRLLVFVNIGIYALKVLRGASSGDSGETSLADAAQNSRFSLFSELGRYLFLLTYAFYPLRKIITSPSKVIILLLCLTGILLSGWRSTLIAFVLAFLMVAFYKRELSFMLVIGGFTYAGLLLLSSEKAFDDLPYGVQRSLCAVPGIHVSKTIENNAEGSSEWRKEMWQWALDPRTRYIKDYVWGDGPGISISRTKRYSTAVMRGAVFSGDNHYFAATGVWHSGWITMMHRFGIVGLVLTVMLQLTWIVYSVLAVFRYRSTVFYPYLVVYFSSVFSVCVMYHLSAGVPSNIFSTFFNMAFCKLFYVKARELGNDAAFFRREPYTPLMIQDINAQEKKHQELVNA